MLRAAEAHLLPFLEGGPVRRALTGFAAAACGVALLLWAPAPADAKKKKGAQPPVATGSTEGGPLSQRFKASDGDVVYWASLDGNRRVCSTVANTGAAAVSLTGESSPTGPVVAVTVDSGTTRVVCGSLDLLKLLCLGNGNCSVAWRVDSLEALP